MAFTTDNSVTGAGTGNGNYLPTSSSTNRNRIPNGYELLTFNFSATQFDTYGGSTAGAYQVAGDYHGAPAGLAAAAASSSQINLTWTQYAGSDDLTFQIGIYSSTDNVSFSLYDVRGLSVASAQVTGLTASTLYYFKLAVVNESNVVQSDYSSTVSATTNAPASSSTIGAPLGGTLKGILNRGTLYGVLRQ